MKKKTFRSSKYLAFVRTLPCSIIDSGGCEGQVVPHHVHAGGVGMKCSDAETIPLCHGHHHEHDITGKITFYKKYNTTIDECLVKTMQAYIEGAQG